MKKLQCKSLNGWAILSQMEVGKQYNLDEMRLLIKDNTRFWLYQIPLNLVKAKMRKLIRQGFVSGCACGCRGDFEITESGRIKVFDSNVFSATDENGNSLGDNLFWPELLALKVAAYRNGTKCFHTPDDAVTARIKMMNDIEVTEALRLLTK